MALKIVGSSPIIHPIKRTPSFRMVFFLWNGHGTRKGGGSFAAAKTVRWTVFSPWESPFLFQTRPVGVWIEWKHLVSGVSLWGYTVFVFQIKGTRTIKCNSPVDCCLPPARRRQHLNVTSPFWRTATPKRKGGTRKGVKKTCQWHVFSPWESPFPFRCGNQIALPPDVKGIDFLRQFDYNAWYKRQLRRQFHD